MRPKALTQLLKAHLRAGSSKESEMGSLYIEGPPGVGKSEVITKAAEEEGAECVDFRLLLRDPTDLRGIPFPDPDNNTARWLPPSELPGAQHGSTGILFLDDMPTAPPLVQASAYQLAIQPHRIGEYQLPPGWVIVGAGNRAQDKALVHNMPKPLANRFMHIAYEVHLDDWVDWAVNNEIDPMIVGFLNSPAADHSEGNLFFQFNPEKKEKAFPTPRTWAKVSRLLGMHLPSEIESEAIAGTVGEGASAAFTVFKRLFDKLPDPMEILEKKNFGISIEGMELMYAMTTSVAQRATTEKHFDNAIEWATKLSQPEFGVLLVKILAGRDRKLVLDSPNFTAWAKNNHDILK